VVRILLGFIIFTQQKTAPRMERVLGWG